MFTRLITAILANRKTTVASILAAVTVIFGAVREVIDGDPMTNPDWNVVVPVVIAALGLLFSRDADKSSQDSGVRP